MTPSSPSTFSKAMSGIQKQFQSAESKLNPSQSSLRRRSKKSRMCYITPPLTPASSIKTAGSVDSSVEAAETEEEFFCDGDSASTRFLLLGTFGSQTDKNALELALLETLRGANIDGLSPSTTNVSDIVKAVDVQNLHNDGTVALVFYDVRQARSSFNVLNKVESSPLLRFTVSQAQREISARYLTAEEVEKKLSDPSISNAVEGGFYLTVALEQPRDAENTGQAREINVRTVTNYLRSFGALQSFTFVRDQPDNALTTKTFRIDFYDCRDASAAYSSLQHHKAFGMLFSAHGRPETRRSSGTWAPTLPESDPRTNKGTLASNMIYSSPNKPLGSIPQFTAPPSTFTPPETLRSSHPQWEGELRVDSVACANPERSCDYCPSRKTPHSHISYHMPPTPSPPIHMCPPAVPHMVMSPPPLTQHPIPIDFNFPPQIYGFPPWAFDKSGPPPHAPAMTISSPPMSFATPMAFCQPWPVEEAPRMPIQTFQIPSNIVDCAFPTGMPMALPFQMPPTPPNSDIRHSSPARPPPSPHLVDSFGRMTLQSTDSQPSANAADVASKNQLVISRIESGQDTRTTVMIKNIPNKMSDKDLIAYINKVCPRRIDFLYLRMDFQNGCNVGYAFVNFIEAQDLLKFAKTKLGEKWNMFSSEKVLQMSYANYQGKEALVEKFKNSCIMDEREAWRPKIFYSFGPNQGLLEPFPSPTHIRRKERSSFNRGALYVPSLHTRNTLNSPLNAGDGQASMRPGHRGGHRRGNRSGAAA